MKKVDEDSVTLTVINQSACASCHARGACSVSDLKEKEIEVPAINSGYFPGEEVTVLFRESEGVKALFYGYLLPFILVLFALILSFETTGNEALAGLSALGILIPYYIILHFFRHSLKRAFNFELEKID